MQCRGVTREGKKWRDFHVEDLVKEWPPFEESIITRTERSAKVEDNQCIDSSCSDLGLAEVAKHRVDELESGVDLGANFGTGQDDFSADEDKKHDLRLHHAVDQTGEELRLVAGESVMSRSQTLETDGKLDVAGADDVLDLEVLERSAEAKLLDDARVLARCQTLSGLSVYRCVYPHTQMRTTYRVILRLGASHDHLSRREDKRRRLGFTNAHDYSRKSLGVVLGISGMESDRLEVQTCAQVNSSDNVLKGWDCQDC
jgi:hypothetical protein